MSKWVDGERKLGILALSGSLRRGSWNRALLEAAVACAPNGMDVHVWSGLGSIPLFNEDDERMDGDDPAPVRELRRLVAAADGVLIATPEYNHSMPGVLKNAIDWLSRARPEAVLERKPVAVTGASTGRWGTRLAQAALRQILGATEALLLPAPYLFVGEVARAFDASGRISDPRLGEALGELLVAFGDWIALHRRSCWSAQPGTAIAPPEAVG